MNEICAISPFSSAITEKKIYLTFLDRLNSALGGNRIKTYLKNFLYLLIYLFGKNSMSNVDNLLTLFYQLDDEVRKEVVKMIQLQTILFLQQFTFSASLQHHSLSSSPFLNTKRLPRKSSETLNLPYKNGKVSSYQCKFLLCTQD